MIVGRPASTSMVALLGCLVAAALLMTAGHIHLEAADTADLTGTGEIAAVDAHDPGPQDGLDHRAHQFEQTADAHVHGAHDGPDHDERSPRPTEGLSVAPVATTTTEAARPPRTPLVDDADEAPVSTPVSERTVLQT